MSEMKLFEGHEVEVLNVGGKVLFNPYHVGECLEIGESAVRMAISKMNEKQVVKLKNSDINKICSENSKVKENGFRKLHNTGENFLTESGVYKLVFRSHKQNAEKFTDWVTDEVLPSIRENGEFSSNKKQIDIEKGIAVVKFIADDLKVAESSRLFMYENYCKDVGIPTGFLPKYEDNGNRERLSMTELLKRNSCGISAVKFNQLLLQAGYLEEKERVSSNGSIKKYKALTEKGLQYGVNLISDKNQKETQPYYYSDRFMELFEEVAA